MTSASSPWPKSALFFSLASSVFLHNHQANAQLFTFSINATKDFTITRDQWDLWNEPFANPNATGVVNITGYDMSTAFPGSASDDWQYTISVKDDVPISPNVAGEDRSVTGIQIRMEVPKNLLRPAERNESLRLLPQDSDTWQVCRILHVGAKLRSDRPISGPGCQGFLPDKCISDLEEALERRFEGEGAEEDTRSHLFPVECLVPRVREYLPQSCNETGLFQGTWAAGLGWDPVPLDHPFDEGFQPVTYDEPISFINLATDPPNEANPRNLAKDYAEATQRVFLVAHIWGTPGRTWVNETRPPMKALRAQVTCIQANVTPGEDESGDGGEDGGDNSDQGGEGENQEQEQEDEDGNGSGSGTLQASSLVLLVSAGALFFSCF